MVTLASGRSPSGLKGLGRIALAFLSLILTSCPGGDAGLLSHWLGLDQQSVTDTNHAEVLRESYSGSSHRVWVTAPALPKGDTVPVSSPVADAGIEAEGGDIQTEQDAERALVSIGRETWIYAEPKAGARRLGYLRFGAVVGRASQPASRDDCSQGWYKIAPDGYVCANGRTATLDLDNRLVLIGRQRPDRLSGLPYVYGTPRGAPPPLYARLPTIEEQKGVEASASGMKIGRDWQTYALSPLPPWLRQTANIFGYPRDKGALLLQSTVARSAFSLLGLFEDEGRVFGLTADLALVPLSRLRPIESSRFHGLALEDRQELPVVFVMTARAGVFSGNPSEGKLSFVRQAGYREAFSTTGKTALGMGSRWVELRSGEWIRDERLLRVEAPANWPSWAVAGRTWVDVSIGAQTLVAYDGTRPVYVTLVSTGAAGLQDPRKTTATKRGTFQIIAKHVTATMDGNEPGHEFDLRDVPWVQYFTEGYALHAAYWHDDFGHPRSHGCVNLSPLDARWLFHFTLPSVPQSWHGVVAHKEATLVNVHP